MARVSVERANLVLLANASEVKVAAAKAASVDVADPLEVRVDITGGDAVLQGDDVLARAGRGRSGSGKGSSGQQQSCEVLENGHCVS